ncbi:aminoacyl-histidine dipeptidase [Marinilabiliaceae bacterium ANBcel2]|nr:aminoacyl-histidine dipeptidase [Marinilabiliaceae bacterium ANBcel2]
MCKDITGLKPERVWWYFNEICKIPRISKHEKEILEYLINFATKHNLNYKQDKAGNIVIIKDACNTSKCDKKVVLQSHVDMVAEKKDSDHNFYKDPIEPRIENDWVKAKNTTLGADNGIGIASQLAILESNNIKHGPLECLFTVDEESGLTGASNLGSEMLTGSILINLDSEDEGELFIGCAGGKDTAGIYTPEFEKCPPKSFGFIFGVKNLKGGHSGDDIDLGHANANKILIRYINEITKRCDFRLSHIEGGNLRNAIAREANAKGIVPWDKKEEVRVILNCLISDIEEEYKHIEPDIKLYLESSSLPEKVFTTKFHNRLINTIYALPHGVIKMSSKMEGLVETSTNLASIKQQDDNKYVIYTSQRSSVESSKEDIASMVKAIFHLSGAQIKETDGYPGWKPNYSSSILNQAITSYQKLYNKKPKIKAIHAGLECGLFLKKYPHLDMISTGPTIKKAHSPNEQLLISSVEKYWKHLIDILENIN